ncbi:hypothetical protein DRN84_04220, partial [Candidatus Geothermarchaeota archaeon]
TAEVILEYSDDGRVYKVIRRAGGVTENIVREEGRPSPYIGRDEVNKVVRESLGLDYRNMMETFIARQGSLTSFIDDKPSERRNRLIELLNLNFERVREDIQRDLNMLKTRLSEYKASVSNIEKTFKLYGFEKVSKEDIASRVDELKSRLRDLEEESKAIEGEIKELEDRLMELSSSKAILSNYINRIDGLREESKRLNSELYRWIREEFSIDLVRDILDTIELSIRNLKFNEERLKKLNEVYDIIAKAIESRDRLKEYQSKLDGYKDLDDSIRRVSSRLEYIKGRREELREIINLLKAGVGECPVCGKPLSEHERDRLLKSYLDELNGLESEESKLTSDLSRLNKLIDERDSISRGVNMLEARLNEYINIARERLKDLDFRKELSLDNLDEVYKAIKESLERLKEFIDGLKENLTRYLKEIPPEYESLDNVILNLKSSIERINEIQREIIHLGNEVEGILAKLNISSLDGITGVESDLRSRVGELKNRLSSLNREKGSVESRISELERLVDLADEYKRSKEGIGELEGRIRLLSKLDEIFMDRGFPLYYLEILVNRVLTDYVNKYLSSIYPEMDVSFKASSTGIDIEVSINGRRRELSTLSGGEKTILGLAVRLGLGEIITRIHARGTRPDFLIIDEGFGPLDEYNRIRVSEVFRKIVESGLYSQVIVISHEREMMDSNYFNSIIEVFREGGVSKLNIRRD